MKRIIGIVFLIASIPALYFMAGDWYKLQIRYGLRYYNARSDTAIHIGIDSTVVIGYVSKTIDSSINRAGSGISDADSIRRISRRYVFSATFTPTLATDTSTSRIIGWQTNEEKVGTQLSRVRQVAIAPVSLIPVRMCLSLQTYNGATQYYSDTCIYMPSSHAPTTLDSITAGQAFSFTYDPASIAAQRCQMFQCAKWIVDAGYTANLNSTQVQVPLVKISGFTGGVLADGVVSMTIIFKEKIPGRLYKYDDGEK